MDNLSKEMIQCKKDGFGCHYGHWKAQQEQKQIEPKDESIDNGYTKKCEWCGVEFMFSRKTQRFCGMKCYHQEYYNRKRKVHG